MPGGRERALIIGAGPGGLSAAAALRRVGIEAEVFERAPELREVGAGFGLQTNALSALLKIGIGSTCAQRGSIVEWQEMYSRKGALLARLPLGEVAREKGVPGVSILRRDYQRELLRHVESDRIHLSHECVAIELEPDGATAYFSNGREERGALLIGADGLGSVVRRYLLGETPRRYSGFTSWRGVSPPGAVPVQQDVIRMYMGPGAQFGVFPVGHGGVYWAGLVTAPEGGADAQGGHRAAALGVFHDWPQPASALIQSSDEAEVVRTDIYDRDPLLPWTKGRVVLLGDAAHPTTPFMGQGLGLAIEDAIVLARDLSLTDGLTDTSALLLGLRGYESRRFERTSTIVLESRKRGEMLRNAGGLKLAVQQRAMRLVPERKWRSVVEQSSGYEI